MRTIKVSLYLFVCVIIICFSSQAVAHRINLHAYVEGETCHVEAYFSQSRKVQLAHVEVWDPQGDKLLEGTTDREGRFSFKIPQKTDLKIVLATRLGHRSDFTIKADEISRVKQGNDQAPSLLNSETGHSHHDTEFINESGEMILVDPDVLQEMLDHTVKHALDEKFKTFYAMLSKTKEEDGVTASRIIAGIGYILGVFGLIMFLASRKKGS
jgi:nickel transport protein